MSVLRSVRFTCERCPGQAGKTGWNAKNTTRQMFTQRERCLERYRAHREAGHGAGGVALANYLSASTIGALPFSTGSGLLYSGAVIADAATSAASRVWVVGSGVAGALAADWWYNRR